MKRQTVARSVAALAIVAPTILSTSLLADSQYASKVISYDPGDPAPTLTDPSVALGEPSRFTGGDLFPGIVSPFNPPFTGDEIVSIGPGGHLTVQFDGPVFNSPNRMYGIDLIVFGNTGFIDSNFPQGIVGGLFGNDGGDVEVSADGKTWHTVPGVKADGLYPPLAYLDAGPYDEKPGAILSDFTRPVDPALTMDHLLGVQHFDLVDLYWGAGGGSGVDLSLVGLDEINYVRIRNPADAATSIEVDGFARAANWKPGDFNMDGMVGVEDLLVLIGAWGLAEPGGPPTDLSGDGMVGVSDLLILIGNWGE